MQNKQKINWVNTLFLILVPIVGIVGSILLGVFGTTHGATWILAATLAGICGLAVTAGYHRLMSHKSYRCAWPVRLLYLLFASGSFEGSALEWCTDHRNHHRYVDTDKDPYSINKGFWYAHIGWLFKLDSSKRDYSNVTDLSKDPLIRFQHRFVVPLGILMGFGLPTAIAALWGDALGGFIIAGALRMTFNHHTTFAINSICHTFGKKNYTDEQTAVDNWFTALLTYGEGYHSFHHKFPVDYRNGIRSYHYDPTKWLIRGLSYLGLASDLKTVKKHRIVKQRVLMKEKMLQEKLAAKAHDKPQEQWLQLVTSVRQGMQQLLQKIEQLEINILDMRRAKEKPHRAQLKQNKKLLKSAYAELQGYLSLWKKLQRHSTRFAYAS